MPRSGPSSGSSKLRVRRGDESNSDGNHEAERDVIDEPDDGRSADGLNRLIMQVLILLQVCCILCFGHYYCFQRHAGRPPGQRRLPRYVDTIEEKKRATNVDLEEPKEVDAATPPKLQDSGVYLVDDASLPTFLSATTNGSLLYFHSKTCIHCQNLTPAYEAAAGELAALHNFPLALASLKATPRAARRYGISHVPTVLLFKRGRMISEMPPASRTADKIIRFVQDSLELAVVTFATRLEFEEDLPQLRRALLARSPPVIVGFQSPGTYEALEFAAEQSRGKTAFLWIGTKLRTDPQLMAYFSAGDRDTPYTGELEPEAVSAWVKGMVRKS